MTTEVAESLPMNRTLRAMLGLQLALRRLHVLPAPGDLPTKLSMEKRKTSTSAPWMLLPKKEVATEEALTTTGVPLRIYLPPVSTGGNGTAVLYIHGGGFALGSPESADWLCREIAAKGFLIASVDYRLAPETPFPGPLDDVVSGLAWLEANRDRFAATRIVVAGDSAGGNLAAALCLRVARDGGPDIAHQALIYPALDCTLAHLQPTPSYAGLTFEDCAAAGKFYAGEADPTDPLISPLLAPSLEGLPPATVLTAEHDVLRGDGRAYAERLEAAGVPVFFRQYPGLPHGFFSMPKTCGPQALRALDDLLRCLAS